MIVSFFKPPTLHPSGNTQVGNDCTELGKTFSKKFEKPLDKYIPLWYNKGTERESDKNEMVTLCSVIPRCYGCVDRNLLGALGGAMHLAQYHH